MRKLLYLGGLIVALGGCGFSREYVPPPLQTWEIDGKTYEANSVHFGEEWGHSVVSGWLTNEGRVWTLRDYKTAKRIK